MDALVDDKLTKNFNVNLTAKYLRSVKRLTLLTLNATTDWGAQYHNHRNFTTTETAQTWYTDATYSLILWVFYVSTV